MGISYTKKGDFLHTRPDFTQVGDVTHTKEREREREISYKSEGDILQQTRGRFLIIQRGISYPLDRGSLEITEGFLKE